MGQQQLLLLVMGIILVGLAVVLGLEIAEKNFMQHDADILIGRCVTIAQDAISWKTKNNPFFNGNAVYTNLESGGFQQLFLLDETENGYFRMGNVQANSFEIFAVSKRYPNVGVKLTVEGNEISDTEMSFSGAIELPAP